MNLKQEKKQYATVFQFQGRLDSTTAPEAEKAVLSAIESGEKNLVFDFASLDYLSSAGIRVLVQCHKKLEPTHGHIFLASIPKPIENVLYITGFLPYFQVCESTQKALEVASQSK
ncbi:MAG: STAS domain-containing protein [Verrucomicrobia bacterium]|nr:STAS domain-containing protein [Verrucomicrobiota bacterium]MBS0646451.1 STAS domain-containing protein [Verrucomicrobiota bacterium]